MNLELAAKELIRRLEVRLSSADAYGLVVSSASGQPQLLINARGQLGIGVSSPTAAVDVRGGAEPVPELLADIVSSCQLPFSVRRGARAPADAPKA